ncbi:hypothetical protein STSP2_02602 [Anaerohalosphaera lusitana]|uniref:FAD-dependent protein C-terminal domain-containing protein n=1 Tax=Anaerohalosphaera lusitana TaxID=1936003 RepID=A0A1U9NND4_9BACT|nr:hypothetical protein [Anaerohalosphaera lusitana]AQT69413.1 hypothetical protein STSP2_02602 [Anaerohalosphaera lusitana]
MLRINDISLPLDHTEQDLLREVCKRLGVKPEQIQNWRIYRRSIDARKRRGVSFVYSVDTQLQDEDELTGRLDSLKGVQKPKEREYTPPSLTRIPKSRPVIVGTGPSGLFAGLLLAEAGLKPIILERGKPAKDRAADVARFWNKGILDEHSNVQFGEGGAGTFSDGKLTTGIKDRACRVDKVIAELIQAGAPEEIRYIAKPHIGTDVLVGMVARIREKIITLGGNVRFETRMDELLIENSHVRGLRLASGEAIHTETVILAIGHSARDTFAMLNRTGVQMARKPFAIGVRIEHPQDMIDKAQYGKYAGHPRLGAAEYKLVHHSDTGRSAYTFCMCPGGEVIGAASEPGQVVTNGMSSFARDRENANAAILVGVKPEDFGPGDDLAGIEFQRKWEQKAFEMGGETYNAPAQTVGDFLAGRPTTRFGNVLPSFRPGVTGCDLRHCLPDYVAAAICEAIPAMSRKLENFDMPDAVLTGVETRSSSPVRILRGDDFCSLNTAGLYPAGEGAGYAGGIISAAVDGIKVAEAVISG